MARDRFLPLVSVQQIEVGALYLDGCSDAEIAELLKLDVATVQREIHYLRKKCARVGAVLPDRPPQTLRAANECQLTDELCAEL